MERKSPIGPRRRKNPKGAGGVKACPRGMISMVPVHRTTITLAVPCSNRDKGGVARKACTASCIACKICERSCPVAGVTVTDNVASIEKDLCVQCAPCEMNCPRQCITDSERFFHTPAKRG